MLSSNPEIAKVAAFIKQRMKEYPGQHGRDYTYGDAVRDNQAGYHGNLTITGSGSGVSATEWVDIEPLGDAELWQAWEAARRSLNSEEE